jgi:hypothetical protein
MNFNKIFKASAICFVIGVAAMGCKSQCDTLKDACSSCKAPAGDTIGFTKSACDQFVAAGNSDACKAENDGNLCK